jgi:hypothetical protein
MIPLPLSRSPINKLYSQQDSAVSSVPRELQLQLSHWREKEGGYRNPPTPLRTVPYDPSKWVAEGLNPLFCYLQPARAEMTSLPLLEGEIVELCVIHPETRHNKPTIIPIMPILPITPWKLMEYHPMLLKLFTIAV